MILKLKVYVLIITFFIFQFSCQNKPSKQNVDQVLNNLHLYASQANGEAYFDLFAEDAVFFGTDINERWDKESFQNYTLARFAEGTGWTYYMKERNIYFSYMDQVCWFDEILTNKKYG
ncbi:MAG: protein with SnoaL 3 domain, NTF 2 superfamily [Candidatus Marinimicrobia bacterium]|nr:protein with SnoaL 3 domain, NTF 2 superfamily [Candidatus Neomarinimicrobiota bacterium]|tara:strand:+ start:462 stop:815 length:354 start_codon:yes stop_codon:yes gene_type:complete